MKTFKQLIEQINETLYLSEGPTHLEYSGYVGKKEYTVKVPRHKDLGDYTEKDLHHKISKENPHLHHHEVTAIVNSGGEEESREKVEHEGKTHTHTVVNHQEPRHLYEEVEQIDELKRETVRTYYNKAIAQGKPIADRMKVGGGDWSKDGQDTKTLKKRAAGVTMALKRRRGEVKMSEDVDLEEGHMKDLAMDIESMSSADFKKKHKKTKQEMQNSLKSEALKGNQHKIDANKNGKVDGHDFKILRNQKKARYQ
jgi:hypothetical protein